MNEHLTHIKYDFDIDYLNNLAHVYKEKSNYYEDFRTDADFDFWKIYRLEKDDDYIEEIASDLNISNYKPRFYWLEENAFLPEHIDLNTECSLNVVLSDEPSPVTVEGIDYVYSSAILNTQRKHSVRNGNKERVLFKLSIFDKSYEEIVKDIPKENILYI